MAHQERDFSATDPDGALYFCGNAYFRARTIWLLGAHTRRRRPMRVARVAAVRSQRTQLTRRRRR